MLQLILEVFTNVVARKVGWKKISVALLLMAVVTAAALISVK